MYTNHFEKIIIVNDLEGIISRGVKHVNDNGFITSTGTVVALEPLSAYLVQDATTGKYIRFASDAAAKIADPYFPKASETSVVLTNPVLKGNIVTLGISVNGGAPQNVNIDLSNLAVAVSKVANIKLDSASNKLIVKDTEDHTESEIDLSEFLVTTSVDSSGVATIMQDNLSIINISKVGQSGSYNDLSDKPSLNFINTSHQASQITLEHINYLNKMIAAEKESNAESANGNW